MTRLIALWERSTGSDQNFSPMQTVSSGLPPVLQGTRMGIYEMREGTLWMPGCTLQTDIRIRCTVNYDNNYLSQNLNFATAYIPILNCTNAVAAKMLKLYALRFNASLLPMATQMEEMEMDKLKLESTRELQSREYKRMVFGADAVTDFPTAWSQY
jgi:hypothetical protein